jgi:Fe-S cluster assembly iron-binding protein IscA
MRESAMVNLSNDAAELIRSLVSDSDLPESAGLRLGTDDASHALAMNLAAVPREDDVVVEHEGAAMWVSPGAAARLEDQTLHAQLEPRPAFFVE